MSDDDAVHMMQAWRTRAWAAEDRLADIRRLHFSRGGYCNEGCGEHPCATYRRAAAVEAEQQP